MSGLDYGRKYTLSYNKGLLIGTKTPSKTVYVFNENEEVINTYKNSKEASLSEGFCVSTLRKYIKDKTLNKGKYYSFDKQLKTKINFF